VTAAIDAAIRTLEAISLYFGELRMLSRALILATVMLLIGCFAAAPADAQATNLEAGKSPSQIFAGTCTACHKSPRGLLKSVPAGSLPGFLRQHYTTSPEMAGVLSSFLISNGATDTRYGGGQGKPDKDAKSDGKPGGPPVQLDRQGRPIHVSREPTKPEAEPQQAAKPDADGISPREEAGRKGRNARRLARPAEDGAKPAEGEATAREAGERGPDGRKLSARQRLDKRGKPVEEMPKEMPKGDKGDAAKTDSGKEEPASAAATKEDKPAGEAVKDESVKPSDEGKSATGKSDTAKVESSKETAPKEPTGQPPSLRADPVPPVTPAPSAPPAASAATSEPASASTPSTKPASPAEPSSPTEPSVPPAAHSAASEPAVVPAPPPAPAAPAGAPEPPISR
jgi:hypothetical protein